MTFLKAFGWFPVPVFYTSRLLGGFAGKMFGAFIVIDPLCRYDRGLHIHEITHFEQMVRHFIVIYALLYMISHKFRYKMEREAYHRQFLAGANLNYLATQLATRYNIDKTYEECLSGIRYNRP